MEMMIETTPSPDLRYARSTSPRRGEEVCERRASLFSPSGRRWPAGPDEGAFDTGIVRRNSSREI
jgi:hypothetical protein